MFLLFGPATTSAQAGPQAGPVSEAAAPLAGPDRDQAGLASEPTGPKAGPGRFPGQHDRDGDGATDGTVTTARSSGKGRKRESGRGEQGMRWLTRST